MNTTQRAFIEGFVKRASEYGYDESRATELLKTSGALSTIAKMQAKGADPRYLKPILSSRKAVADQIRAARNIAPQWGENSAIREAYSRPSTTLHDRSANLAELNDSIHLAIEHTDHISPRDGRSRIQNILGDDLLREARSRLRPRLGLPQRVFTNVESRIDK